MTDLGILKGEDVAQSLMYMTVDLQKQQKKKTIQRRKRRDKAVSDNVPQGHPTQQDNESYHVGFDSPHNSSPNKIPKEVFSRIIIKISHVITKSLELGCFVPLDIPDGFVNEALVRISFSDQLGIKLSRPEVRVLCERLRTGNADASSPSKVDFRSDEEPFLPQINIKKSKLQHESEVPEDIILGKYVKVFITSIKQMCSKRIATASCKPLFVK